MTTADYIALSVTLLGIATSCVGLAMENLTLMWIGIAVALPATVVKVRLTRARSQAAEREEQARSRERRTPRDTRNSFETAATS